MSRKIEKTLTEFRKGSLFKSILDLGRNTDVTHLLYLVVVKNTSISLLPPETRKLATDSVCNTDPSRNKIEARRQKSELKLLVDNLERLREL